jgi:hypothetical protein
MQKGRAAAWQQRRLLTTGRGEKATRVGCVEATRQVSLGVPITFHKVLAARQLQLAADERSGRCGLAWALVLQIMAVTLRSPLFYWMCR